MNTPSDDRQRAEFEKLFRDTRRDLLAYLLRRAATADDAADLLSETYLTAWRRLTVVPPGDEARLWLFGVARNLLLRHAGRRHSGDHLVERLANELRTAHTEGPPPDDEQFAPVRLAFSRLPERDREILTLAAWDGLTPREIAAVVGTSANSIRVRLHRIRARLRRQLPPARRAPPAPTALLVERER